MDSDDVDKRITLDIVRSAVANELKVGEDEIVVVEYEVKDGVEDGVRARECYFLATVKRIYCVTYRSTLFAP